MEFVQPSDDRVGRHVPKRMQAVLGAHDEDRSGIAIGRCGYVGHSENHEH